MGEVVVSSEVVEVTETAAEDGGEKLQRRRKDDGDGNSEGLVKWERFLPKISLRVLLVEADDSTRQIVEALLRKCCYRVASVHDGLKAWEMLKGRPESVDLILIEADLPSISGYALLTLIMEHETCKNIPVIMMSKQDSVSTVYKCMLRGAADYLVKPLRRNELRNLWQHVWRRQRSFAAGDVPLDECDGQRKLKATSEENSTSNHGDAIERDEQPVTITKGSDDESSCTRPDMECERANVDDNNQRISLQTESGKSLFNHMQVPENETQSTQGVENVTCVQRDSCKEAIDFMGAPSRRREECNGEEESTAKYEPESRLKLDLSLRRSDTSEEQPGLWPSCASAFIRYVHRPLQTQRAIPAAAPDQRNCSNSSDAATYNDSSSSDPPPSAPRNDQTTVYTKANAPGPPPSVQTRRPWPCVPIPVKGIRFSGQNKGCTSASIPAPTAQTSPSSTTSPSSVSPQEYCSRFHPLPRSGLQNGIPESSANSAVHKLDSAEERRYGSSLTEQSVIGGFCSRRRSGNADQQPEKKREDGKTQRSLQREAALTKFRMKRKDRCFEKKVRYESRKKMAEQRPRVKGQFVRQAQVSEPSTSTQTK